MKLTTDISYILKKNFLVTLVMVLSGIILSIQTGHTTDYNLNDDSWGTYYEKQNTETSSKSQFVKLPEETKNKTGSFVYGIHVAPTDELDIENMESYFQIARDLGMPCIRIGVLWDIVIPSMSGEPIWNGYFQHPRTWPPVRTRFDFDQIAHLAEKYNISIFPAFARSRNPERELDAEKYTQFVVTFLKRYKEKMNIKYIEFHNEPAETNDGINGGRKWSGTAEQLVHVTNTAYKKIKSIYPGVMVGSVGFCTGSYFEAKNYTLPFYEHFFKAKPIFDFFALHDYPKELSKTQGTKVGELMSSFHVFDTYRNMLDKNGYKDIPIFITEGYDDKPMFSSNRNLWDWTDEDEASVSLLESYVHIRANAKKNIIMGKILSGIKTMPHKTLGMINRRGNRIRPHYYFLKYIVQLLRQYPLYSNRFAGKLNSTDFWIETFQNNDGKRMWVAFAPLNYETMESENKLPAVLRKNRKTQQTFTFCPVDVKRVTISTITQGAITRENKTVPSKGIQLEIGKKPIFIQEI